MSRLSWSKSPQDLANLLYLSVEELVIIYSIPKTKIMRLRKQYEHLIKRGTYPMPPRNPEYDGNPDAERERVIARQRRVSKTAGKVTAGMVEIIVPEEHLSKFEKLKTFLEEKGNVSKARFSDYQQGSKNADGEYEKHDLSASRFTIEFESEPKWPVVTAIKGNRLPKKEAKTRPDGGKRAVILPDLQFPYVDEQALGVAIQIIQDVKPDQIIFIGDTLDLSAWGKYVQRPEFAEATKHSFKQLYDLLYGLRADNRHSDIIVLEGNHEARMDKDLLLNAQNAYGLKKVTQPEGWPVMSVPNLCDFESLDVEYIPGYPANRYWLNERLQIIHGDLARPSGKSARAVVSRERVSTIFGHTHRIEQASQTSQDYNGGKQHHTFNIGTLSKIDGGVPSVKTGYDTKTGAHIENYMDWQHGLMVVDYQEGDAPFHAQQVHINTFDGYTTRFNGKTYKP